MKILIVGGVAGGAEMLLEMRRIDESVEIILLEKGKYICMPLQDYALLHWWNH